MQIGIVVRDLDATVRRYLDDYGIGLWQLIERTGADIAAGSILTASISRNRRKH